MQKTIYVANRELWESFALQADHEDMSVSALIAKAMILYLDSQPEPYEELVKILMATGKYTPENARIVAREVLNRYHNK
jgi:hypothetical protein